MGFLLFGHSCEKNTTLTNGIKKTLLIVPVVSSIPALLMLYYTQISGEMNQDGIKIF